MDVRLLATNRVLVGADGDVGRQREAHRRRRLRITAGLLGVWALYLYVRWAQGNPVRLGLPHLSVPASMRDYIPGTILVLALALVIVVPMLVAGRSPHMLFRPSEIPVRLEDVVGLGVVRDEVLRSLNLFLAHRTFRETMGGNPRRAILFEGPPGTGKTYMAKAMAREARVPFLFVSATAFQSMYYGQTSRKIRAYFRALRKAARREGGAIGFIEEIDAIAGARRGMANASPVGVHGVFGPYDMPGRFGRGSAGGGGVGSFVVERADMRDGIAGVVNELLVQMQSFDEPTWGARLTGVAVDRINRFLPAEHQIAKPAPTMANVLVIGATNRATDLDPALLRPGRFDRCIHFDLPSRSGRREIIDYYIDRKAHVPEWDKDERREQLAAITFGYSPVMIEHLFDEALVWALRDGRDAMDWADVQQAKFTEEIGLKQPVEYTRLERATIATHESGHAVVAYLVGGARKLEVLSIIKRRDALGLLAHSETEERFTHTRSELVASIQISFGGMTAEELFFGESGTGPGSDLAAATRVAAQMVGAFGMAGTLVSYQATEGSPWDQGIVARVLGDDDGRRAVERLLETAKEDVREILDTNRDLVEALRDALLDREELIGDEITDVLHRAQALRDLPEV